MNTGRRCAALRSDGQPCRAWAKRHAEPPRCNVHAGPAGNAEPAPTGRAYPLDDVVGLLGQAGDHSLDNELAAVRLAISQVLLQLQEELSPAEFARLTGLIFSGASTVARLMAARRTRTGEPAGALARILTQALDELSIEWKVNL